MPQDESRARYYRMRTADDGRIDWSASNAAITTWSGRWWRPGPARSACLPTRRSSYGGRGLSKAMLTAPPGTVIRCDDDGVRIAAGSGSVQLLELELDGVAAGWPELRRAGLTTGVRLIGPG